MRPARALSAPSRAAAFRGLAAGSAAFSPRRAPGRTGLDGGRVFTSQGCTSCRAVDPMMRDLAHKPGILALTLPVTYWDYLGWRDTLGLRALNERQRAYSRSHGLRQVRRPSRGERRPDRHSAPTARRWTGWFRT